MAEVVYKKISELDNATVPLTGSELIGVSATGVSKKASIEGMHGAGWWNVLKVAFTSLVAPEATHAVDSDTCGEEAPSDFHDAAQLTGAIHLDRIPEELTGKNAATATLAATATNATTAVLASSNLVAGGIGSHAFCANIALSTLGFGDTISGSSLKPIGFDVSQANYYVLGIGTYRNMEMPWMHYVG